MEGRSMTEPRPTPPDSLFRGRREGDPISAPWPGYECPGCGYDGMDCRCDEASDQDPYVDDFGRELECTRCGGEGTCDDNANPLWDCDDSLHPCHACHGSGKRRDQEYM
jgi:hypothetical protein